MSRYKYQHLYEKEETGYEELTTENLFLVLVTSFIDNDIVIELKKRYDTLKGEQLK